MKRIAWYTLLVLITITVLILGWQFRQALVLLLFSLAVSAAFRPLIDYFIDRGAPRKVALILSYLAVLGAIALLIWTVSGPLISDLEQVSNQIAIRYEHIQTTWPESDIPAQRSLASQLPPVEELFVSADGEGSSQLFQGLMGFTTNLVSLIGNLGLILILSLYWTTDRMHFERLLLSLIPVNQRAKVRRIWRGIEKGVGAYIQSELVQSLLAGGLLWLGYSLMGLEYPVLLAVLGALAWLIPWFGAVIAMIPLLLVGISSNLTLGILAAVYTLCILVVQEYFIEPRIFRRKSYSSVILVLVILILTDAFGLIGLILAPLLSATIQNIFKYILQPPFASDALIQDPGDPFSQTALLRERLEQTKGALEDHSHPPSPQVVNLMERLDRLIADTDRYLYESLLYRPAPARDKTRYSREQR